jgi:hypothetical protein
MIAHNNAPMLLSAQFLWGPIFVLAIIFLEPRLFSNQIIFVNLIFFIAYGFILPKLLWTEMSDWYAYRQPIMFSQILLPILMFVWLQKVGGLKVWRLYSKIGIIFIIITCIMTIIATELDPTVVRVSYSDQEEGIRNFMFYRKLGIGSYGYMIALILLFPPLIYLIKKNGIKAKRLLLVLLLIVFYTLLKAQIFANILVSCIAIVLAVSGSKNIRRSLSVSVLLLIVVFVLPKELWATIFVDLSSHFPKDSNVYYKLNDMAIFINQPEIFDTNTGAGGRMERYPLLWQIFIESPIWGDASYKSSFKYELDVGGHLFWMSRLTLWGTVGFAFFVYLLYLNFKTVYKSLSSDFRFYYLISVFAFILLGLTKSLTFLESFIVLFVIIPGLDIKDKKDFALIRNEKL